MVLNEDDAPALAAYLVASSDICRQEPEPYGPVRLLDGTKRLALSVAPRTEGDAHRFWAGLAGQIEQKLFTFEYEPEGWEAFVDQMPRIVASEVERRPSTEKVEMERNSFPVFTQFDPAEQITPSSRSPFLGRCGTIFSWRNGGRPAPAFVGSRRLS